MKSRCGIVLSMSMWLAFGLPAHADSGGHACAEAAPATISNAAAANTRREFDSRRVVRDRVLHTNWEMIVDCAHPEQPPKMVQLARPPSIQNIPVAIPVSVDQAIVPVTRKVLSRMPRAGKTETEARKPQAIARLEPISSPPFGQRAIPSTLPRPVVSAALKPIVVRAMDRVHLWSSGTNFRLEIEAIALEYGRVGQVIHLRRLGSDTEHQVILTGIVVGPGSAELLP